VDCNQAAVLQVSELRYEKLHHHISHESADAAGPER